MCRRVCTVGLAAVLVTVYSGCGSTRVATDVAAVGSAKANLTTEQVYRVPSGSMEPTLGIGAMVIVSPGAPKVGEIVVFHPPERAELEECGPTAHVVRPGGAACARPLPTASTVEFIKRVVAGPGDEIYIGQGHVYRKTAGSSSFARQPAPYIRRCGAALECNFPTPIKISAEHWYMLGDNRGESDDSRFYGAVPASWIVGIVTACAPRTSRMTLDQRLSIQACKLPTMHG